MATSTHRVVWEVTERHEATVTIQCDADDPRVDELIADILPTLDELDTFDAVLERDVTERHTIPPT